MFGKRSPTGVATPSGPAAAKPAPDKPLLGRAGSTGRRCRTSVGGVQTETQGLQGKDRTVQYSEDEASSQAHRSAGPRPDGWRRGDHAGSSEDAGFAARRPGKHAAELQ